MNTLGTIITISIKLNNNLKIQKNVSKVVHLMTKTKFSYKLTGEYYLQDFVIENKFLNLTYIYFSVSLNIFLVLLDEVVKFLLFFYSPVETFPRSA